MKKYLNLFDFRQKINYTTEVLSGLTVALALVPEAVAFAFLAGLSPLTGLYAAFSIGLITSIFGRPGMISGATGAIAIVFIRLIQELKLADPSINTDTITQYIFVTVVLAGIIQMLAGFFKLDKFIRLVPQSVMYGFVNGLAIVIFMAQFSSFKTEGEWMSGSSLYIMLGLVFLTMLIIFGLPKLTKVIPSSLAAILVVFGLVKFLDLQTTSVGDLASIKGGFPPFAIPSLPLDFNTWIIIIPYALLLLLWDW